MASFLVVLESLTGIDIDVFIPAYEDLGRPTLNNLQEILLGLILRSGHLEWMLPCLVKTCRVSNAYRSTNIISLVPCTNGILWNGRNGHYFLRFYIQQKQLQLLSFWCMPWLYSAVKRPENLCQQKRPRLLCLKSLSHFHLGY